MNMPALFIALVYVAVGAFGLIIGEYSFRQQISDNRLQDRRLVIHGQKARYWAFGWFVAAAVALVNLTLAFVALVIMMIIAVPLCERESRAQSRSRRWRDKNPPISRDEL